MNENEMTMLKDVIAECVSKYIEKQDEKKSVKKPHSSFHDPLGYNFDFINPMALEKECDAMKEEMASQISDPEYRETFMSERTGAILEMAEYNLCDHGTFKALGLMLRDLMLKNAKQQLEYRVTQYNASAERRKAEAAKNASYIHRKAKATVA